MDRIYNYEEYANTEEIEEIEDSYELEDLDELEDSLNTERFPSAEPLAMSVNKFSN